MTDISIHFENAFVEQAVFCKIHCLENEDKRNPLVADYHARRVGLYETKSAEARETEFRKFYNELFENLGLKSIFESSIREFPVLVNACLQFHVRRAMQKKRESSDLFSLEGHKTVLILLEPERLSDENYVGKFLRHELMHASDMLDPAFAYSPEPALPEVSSPEYYRVRERFKVLWDIYVTLRLLEAGHEGLFQENELLKQFIKAYQGVPEDTQKRIYFAVMEHRLRTQQDLLALAQGCVEGFDRGRSFTCPFCDATGEHVFVSGDPAKDELAQYISAKYPRWSFREAICRQCFDLFDAQRKMIPC